MVHDPLSPSEALRTRLGRTFLVVAFLTTIYATVVMGQPLFGLWILSAGVGLYVLHRLLAVLDSIADAAQRVAAVREREVGIGPESIGNRSGADPEPVREDVDGSSEGTER